MSAPKTKSTANGTTNSKGLTATYIAPATSVPEKAVVQTLSKPDKPAHDAEQERIKAEIAVQQEKLVRHVSPLPLLAAVIPNNV
jgi:hypothetical protein